MFTLLVIIQKNYLSLSNQIKLEVQIFLDENICKYTFFKIYGASTFNLHRLSVVLIAPSLLSSSSIISHPTKTGICGHVGNLRSYAY